MQVNGTVPMIPLSAVLDTVGVGAAMAPAYVTVCVARGGTVLQMNDCGRSNRLNTPIYELCGIVNLFSSGASVVAIDNKIEQAMDLVKSHLMYAVREEVEVLKEQIKELIEKNSQLEQENSLLKTLASPEQLAQFQAQLQSGSPPSSSSSCSQPAGNTPAPAQPASQSSGPSA
ncbi:TSC22 domain family protein 1 isoform X3 [Ascaphus truei]|uniref:TSC22 domain family protein 1 isoform X3 n=1 Tax=Ascaphus truei TaxID=8439 RepID=UPI003F590D90